MKGKVKTLLLEDTNNLKDALLDFDGDIKTIQMTPKVGEIRPVVDMLNGLTLFEVVSKPDENLEGLGISSLDYFAVNPIIVSDINNTEPDHILFNGDVKIPRVQTQDVGVIGTYFLDEETANQF